ncbi:MAG: hypothetical protein AAB394_02530 [Patescibacteria group bacterium]
MDIKNKEEKKWAPEGWTQEEWEIFFNGMEQLSLEEIKEISDAGEIKFFNSNIRKDDYLNVIDEGDKEKMIKIYNEILSKKNTEVSSD